MTRLLAHARKLSLAGIFLRLISFYGLHLIWVLGSLSVRMQHEANLEPKYVHSYAMLIKGEYVAGWETLAVTAALWAAAWTFDKLKARPCKGQGVFESAFVVTALILAAELPVTFASRTIISSKSPIYFDYTSAAICAIAICLLLTLLKGKKLRTELEQFV